MDAECIEQATDRAALEDARRLFVEYAESLGFSLCFQGFDRELATLPGRYAPPRGRLLVARVDGAPAGCVAVRELEPGIGEMKRLYVRPAFRGTGLGRRLAERATAEAQAIGHRVLRLDTLPRMTTAIALYRKMGFREIAAYYDGAPPDAVCMEMPL